MKKVLNIIKNIIFIILILLLSFYLLISAFFPSKTISTFGFSFYRVVSSSMSPEINVNDVVCVVAIDEEDLEVGNIINFQTYTQFEDQIREITVTHFLGNIYTEESRNTYRTQSYKHKEEDKFDSWLDEDGNYLAGIRFEDINGKVAFRIPYLGHLIQIFQSPVMVLLLGLNVYLIVLVVKMIKRKDIIEDSTA
ncbi:MAG: hypothetical protein PHX62_02505 [Bacilli bacterium]|nr:hypothetical protein [Bacilli bacterium]